MYIFRQRTVCHGCFLRRKEKELRLYGHWEGHAVMMEVKELLVKFTHVSPQVREQRQSWILDSTPWIPDSKYPYSFLL